MTKWLSPLARTRKIDPLPPPPPPDRSVGGWEGVFRNGSIFLHHRENEAGQKEEKRKGGGGGDYHSIDESSGFGGFGLEPACLGQRVFETDGG